MADFPQYLDVDYTDGEGESPEDYPALEDKLEKAIEVTKTGLQEYQNPAVMWTGGKDSTLTLYFVKEVAEQYDLDLPPTIFIDHFQHFDELIDFVEHWADEWDLEVVYARNEDVGSLADEPGDEIRVEDLNEQNRHHVRNILEYEEDTFPFLLDTYVGNHLLKTVALNNALEEYDIDGIISGIRWDEQEARADETFFSPRHDPDIYPPHDRVQPILQFEERDVWDAFWNFVVPETVEDYPAGHVPQDYDDLPNDLTHEDIPVSPKYFAGFRSLGSEVSTDKSAEEPAWLQDLEGTTERAGRAQDKEDLMARLRDLGYM
ncbi:phosphoadenosine phosphosulfate reductase family protein [Halomarina halobia]|uniref:Phosphoadenosine phosphosulfate reductase family protein n=1 Tax=Halomarina halobia TaxID=3033386 RepID=A0ABD6AB72_9EURY|nr:phosphoadenosine phosphosulfate reductase family protein [Halomarina sp. PSR21]